MRGALASPPSPQSIEGFARQPPVKNFPKCLRPRPRSRPSTQTTRKPNAGRRTRQLILIGSVVKKKADQDSKTRLWLDQALDEALDRLQDRELFDLPPNKENTKGTPYTTAPTVAATSNPLPGWRPNYLKTGSWGSIYLGDTSILPSELVGTRITVQSKDGQFWTTTVTAVLDRSSEQVIVTNSGRPK